MTPARAFVGAGLFGQFLQRAERTLANRDTRRRMDQLDNAPLPFSPGVVPAAYSDSCAIGNDNCAWIESRSSGVQRAEE